MKPIAFALLATFALCSAAPAIAGDKLAACAADLQKFCPGSTDKHDQKKCLKSHRSDLSSTCTDQMDSKKSKGQDQTPAATPGTHA